MFIIKKIGESSWVSHQYTLLTSAKIEDAFCWYRNGFKIKTKLTRLNGGRLEFEVVELETPRFIVPTGCRWHPHMPVAIDRNCVAYGVRGPKTVFPGIKVNVKIDDGGGAYQQSLLKLYRETYDSEYTGAISTRDPFEVAEIVEGKFIKFIRL
jgi:hypothetical protein